MKGRRTLGVDSLPVTGPSRGFEFLTWENTAAVILLFPRGGYGGWDEKGMPWGKWGCVRLVSYSSFDEFDWWVTTQGQPGFDNRWLRLLFPSRGHVDFGVLPCDVGDVTVSGNSIWGLVS